MSSRSDWRASLIKRIRARRSTVGVVGLGYVGLPLLLAAEEAGFSVVGLDTDRGKISAIKAGKSYITDVDDSRLRRISKTSKLTTQHAGLRNCDVMLITVPTPLRHHAPDLSFIEEAARAIGKNLKRGTLVVLESTTYPGTTEEVVLPELEASGLKAGEDFALAYAPERIDPGQDLQHLVKTPRVVGGLTPKCTKIAAAFYGEIVDEVHTVSSPREAEMAKLIENTFRHVNIALVNELAMISPELGVNIWEALKAASTKPYGYMPFWPGPGVGGHCIAIDPSFLSWRVGQRLGHHMTFVEHSQEVNTRMPAYVVSRVAEALNDRGKAIRGSKIMAVGVAYKANVNDYRESPALAVIKRLSSSGASVSFHDPFVEEIRLDDKPLTSVPLTKKTLGRQDCVVVLTAHNGIDYEKLVEASELVFDTRGIEGISGNNVVRL